MATKPKHAVNQTQPCTAEFEEMLWRLSEAHRLHAMGIGTYDAVQDARLAIRTYVGPLEAKRRMFIPAATEKLTCHSADKVLGN